MKFPLSPPAFKFAFAALLLARVGTVSAGEAPDIFGEGSSEIGTFNEIVSFFQHLGRISSADLSRWSSCSSPWSDYFSSG